MSQFEVFYGKQCKVPLSWGNLEGRKVSGPHMLAQMETMVKQIYKHNLKTTHDRHKSYVDTKITSKEYSVGEHVFLRVKPKKSTLRTWLYVKLARRYLGPFEVLERVGLVDYQLALPPHISIHDVFHVSLLKKYIVDKSHITDWNNVEVEPKGYFYVEPMHIIETREVMLRK